VFVLKAVVGSKCASRHVTLSQPFSVGASPTYTYTSMIDEFDDVMKYFFSILIFHYAVITIHMYILETV